MAEVKSMCSRVSRELVGVITQAAPSLDLSSFHMHKFYMAVDGEPPITAYNRHIDRYKAAVATGTEYIKPNGNF